MGDGFHPCRMGNTYRRSTTLDVRGRASRRRGNLWNARQNEMSLGEHDAATGMEINFMQALANNPDRFHALLVPSYY